ncbi:AMP-binding protein [Thermofilum pendens]|uniref:AMP-dependent synthetase and ligase n=1 Tax=Thermofilum pendens (strain DSM 2475 / Hrk 5) TaxID=368408 RepID=A1S0M6_THEPD|nr:AMP-binding protein [Thermofilum pendens]ABL79006.1 AMP-dependent synthetase and ligase [Thermofilum pendens Hrk 5]
MVPEQARRVVPPSARFKVMTLAEYRRVYRESVEDVYGFWSSYARLLLWRKPWERVVEGEAPRVRWFAGGELSPYENVVSRHRGTPVWRKVAVLYESESGDAEVLTYEGLDALAGRIAGWLESVGVGRGDWVTVYSPPNPESLAFMLAAMRVGAPFEPVFTGFGYYELAKRIARRGSRVVFTVDGYTRRGREVDTLGSVLRAVEESGAKPVLLVSERLGRKVPAAPGVYTLDEALSSGAYSGSAVLGSSEPLFGLHSAYRDDFKPLSYPAAGFLVQVYATSRWIGLKPRETLFNTVWPGWITGVSYLVFGPLMTGSTVVLYDGAPDWRGWDRWISIVESYGVTLLLTTSGALRLMSRQPAELFRSHDYDSLKAVLVTAEPLDAETWGWAYSVLGTLKRPLVDSVPSELSGAIPVLDLYIQSEVGTFLVGNLPSYTFTHIVPGTCGPPMPGFHVEVLEDGRLVVRKPWPAIPVEAPGDFWEKWREGFYDTGDAARYSVDGYIEVLGRRDGVMKVSGYRVSPGAIERVVAGVPGVRGVRVYARPDPLKFEVPVVSVEGSADPEAVRKAVREKLGPILEPAQVTVPQESHSA